MSMAVKTFFAENLGKSGGRARVKSSWFQDYQGGLKRFQGGNFMKEEFDTFLPTPPEIFKAKTFICNVIPETELGQNLSIFKCESDRLEAKMFFLTEELLVKANPASTVNK